MLPIGDISCERDFWRCVCANGRVLRTRNTVFLMTAEYSRRHRNGLIAAAVACLATIGAVLTTGSALIRPIEPARHTIVVAATSLTYGNSDVEADRYHM